jgi:spore photoproduct lyase
MTYLPQSLLIEKAVADTPLARRVLDTWVDIPTNWVEKVDQHSIAGDTPALEIVQFWGDFIKPCPGTRFYTCCGYEILNLASQCSLGCTYCILQAYFSNPNLRLFANLDVMWQQLRDHLRHSPKQVHRIGTGEFTDSLLLDPITRLSRELVPFFATQANAVLELKTKTAQVELLERLDHRGHTIVAWSLNPEQLIDSEERGSASLEERLAAARQCQEWGYRLAFHFDPLIAYPHWQRGYSELVERLFAAVDPTGIAWISLGTLRFMPSLKTIIREHHPTSDILNEEFVQGLDGKLRYFRDLRVRMYQHLSDLLWQQYNKLCIYLCMESEDIWRESLGFAPAEQGGLSKMLDRQALP